MCECGVVNGYAVFAFIKGDHEVTVSVPEGATRKQVAYLLASNDIIEYEWAFNLYMIYQSDGETEFIPGEHTLNSNMNYSQLITALTVEPYVRTEIRVTIPEGYTVDLPNAVHNVIDKRTDPSWPTTWFVPRLTGEGAFSDVYSVMANWGANHGVTVYGHVGSQLITLASMLRIPVNMHNVEPSRIFRPHAWSAFGTQDTQSADYRACAAYGPLYK